MFSPLPRLLQLLEEWKVGDPSHYDRNPMQVCHYKDDQADLLLEAEQSII
jgi:hypothetical protein